jgi:peptide/nickel transport system ATP-binding protein
VRCHLYPRTLPIEIKSELEPSLDYQPFGVSKVILTVKNLSVKAQEKKFWFKKSDEEWLLQQIHFQLFKGKTLAIVGESGSGKTTLARTIVGLYPKFSGQVDIAPDLKPKDIQFIFQDPSAAMNPRWQIRQILLEGNHLKEEQELFWILDAVQMNKRCLGLYPHELSGGQRQRIAIARALLAQPQILICDEPTSALDISVQAQILNLLKNIQSEFGLSYILITHDLDVVGYLADEVCVLKDGLMVETGHVEQILKAPLHEYTRYLLSARNFFDENKIKNTKGD